MFSIGYPLVFNNSSMHATVKCGVSLYPVCYICVRVYKAAMYMQHIENSKSLKNDINQQRIIEICVACDQAM